MLSPQASRSTPYPATLSAQAGQDAQHQAVSLLGQGSQHYASYEGGLVRDISQGAEGRQSAT